MFFCIIVAQGGSSDMMVFLFAALVLTNKSIHPGNYTVDG
jgi:hypothetical protein